ncbi:MAG TPA: PQQ-binding-like beta-propeller repeat protein [Solirubrobacteraceae bacterium]|nr:PQQ-binding-like beta-propeller repeat protein [Solirubrobacteraceae bacterium]
MRSLLRWVDMRAPRGLIRALAAVSCGAAIAACGTAGTSSSSGAAATAGSGTAATAGSGATGTVSGDTTSAVLSRAAARIPSGDWPTFGYDAAHSGAGPASGITAANARRLLRRRVTLDTTIDSAPIELHAVTVRGRPRDVIVVTGDNGRTVAVDAGTGARLWEYYPRGDQSQVTDTTPVADPGRTAVYAASPDGTIHKLALATGRQLWARSITTDPGHEKMDSALTVTGRYVIATTGGYYGDAPPYDGHVVAIDRATGRIGHVFNAECSNQHALISPTACPVTATRGGSAFWARAGAIVEPGSGNLLVVTGNGPFNGSTDWGDTVLELAPDASRVLHSWTPRNERTLFETDTDLGSTGPALLGTVGGRRLAVQGGKQGVLSLLDVTRLNGTTGPASSRLGGELQQISAPGGQDVFTQPAVWHDGSRTIVFVATNAGTAAYTVTGGSRPRLRTLWSNGVGGTSPVLSGGLLYVYDQQDGRVDIRRPLTGILVRALPAGTGHWNSPIVVGGRVIEPTGDYHAGRGPSTLEIWHLPGR